MPSVGLLFAIAPLQHLDVDAQHVAGAHRVLPLEVGKARRPKRLRAGEDCVARDAHRHATSVPAAGDQALPPACGRARRVGIGEAVVVLDTGTRRGLVDSAYNERRRQCEVAARFFGVRALRRCHARGAGARPGPTRRPDISPAPRHVISENDRVMAARDAMRRNDPQALGKLLDASHASLRDDFEVSNRDLDAIVSCAQTHSACFGARMTGAGFGGCAVALVRADLGDDFGAQVSVGYTSETGLAPQVYVCRASDGARIVMGA